MSTAFIDIRWGLPAGQETAPNTGWVRYSGGRDYPSPTLLRSAAAVSAPVSFHFLTRDEARAIPDELRSRLLQHDRVVIAAPPIYRHVAEALRNTLAASASAAQVSLLDPWQGPADVAASSEPGYALANGQAMAHAELDTLPYRDSVHPWVCPLPPGAPPVEGWQDRLAAAVAGFAPRDPELLKRPIWQAWERDLLLNDHRIPLDMDRVRGVARLVSSALKQHSTMLKLHLAAWPKDLLENDRVADHLTLLPVGALDLLVGSLSRGQGLTKACTTDEIIRSFAALRAAGMSHVTGISVVLGLPGQSAEDCLNEIQEIVKAMVAARILRVRFAYWLGEDKPLPRSPEHMQELFLASHPDWYPVEYAGLFDFIALLQNGMKQVEIIGPGFLPEWPASTTNQQPA